MDRMMRFCQAHKRWYVQSAEMPELWKASAFCADWALHGKASGALFHSHLFITGTILQVPFVSGSQFCSMCSIHSSAVRCVSQYYDTGSLPNARAVPAVGLAFGAVSQRTHPAEPGGSVVYRTVIAYRCPPRGSHQSALRATGIHSGQPLWHIGHRQVVLSVPNVRLRPAWTHAKLTKVGSL